MYRTSQSRRSFVRAAAGIAGIQAYQNHVNTNSKPSDLKITDMRIAVVARAPMTCPAIPINTKQGIYGLGERDGASKNYALFLKNRLPGENPRDVDPARGLSSCPIKSITYNLDSSVRWHPQSAAGYRPAPVEERRQWRTAILLMRS
jgi:hypothetical protein